MLTQRTRSYCWGFYVSDNFGENRSINAIVRVRTGGQTDRRTDANRLYNLSNAICDSYGADNKTTVRVSTVR